MKDDESGSIESLFFIYTERMAGIVEGSVRFAHSGPSHNLLRPAIAELVSCGPLPLPVSGGGHASAIPAILCQYVCRF